MTRRSRSPDPQLIGLHRDNKHRYSWNGGPWYPGITSIIDMLDKSAPLIGWAKRVVAEAALVHHADVGVLAKLNRNEAKSFLMSRPDYEKDLASDLGHRVHTLAEQHGLGREMDEAKPDELGRIVNYRAWVEQFKPEFLAAEFMVYSETHLYGGTMDVAWMLWCDEHQKLCRWMVDYKTGKGIYAKTALQLVAGARADWIGFPDDPIAYPITTPEHYGVLHITNDFAKLVEYNVDDQEWEAFLACRTLKTWDTTRAPKALRTASTRMVQSATPLAPEAGPSGTTDMPPVTRSPRQKPGALSIGPRTSSPDPTSTTGDPTSSSAESSRTPSASSEEPSVDHS